MLNDKLSIKIRHATQGELIAINDIYNYYVLNSTCTFQTEPESMKNRRVWFKEHGPKYPLIVAEEDGEVIGWASLSKFKKREAYRPTVESSIYIRNDRLFKGIGAVLLSELIKSAGEIGYHSIIAVISSDQGPSIKLHEKNGFIKVAHLKEVGRKFDRWLDVLYYQLPLS